MTDTLRRLLAEHLAALRTPPGPDDYCTACGELWPCATANHAEALAELVEAVKHIRGLASGEGGDEASRADPWNALATIVINCDETLAKVQQP